MPREHEIAEMVETIDVEPWGSSLRLAFKEMAAANPLYRPTNFWQPGVEGLLKDMSQRGLERFKSWPSSSFFFYPKYPYAFTNSMVAAVMPTLTEVAPAVPTGWFNAHLVGSSEANKDLDVTLAGLDNSRLPLALERHGESAVGEPPQRYRPFGADGPSFGRPTLNYLKILSAVSRVIDEPPESVLELGSGFGALGEILMASLPGIQYVNLDIPPLSVVAHYYLSTVFPAVAVHSNLDLAESGGHRLGGGEPSASLSSWHLPMLTGTPDLFVNAFSFQEMEPHVVANYAELIAELGTRTVVSLNSRRGKPLSQDASVGVLEQVTSAYIETQFTRLGYDVAARHGRPFAPSQAELVILRRS